MFTNLNLSIVFEIIIIRISSHALHKQAPITGLLSSSVFISALIMSAESSTGQVIKALQAQNAQFQELFMNLAKGQQYLKTLILKEKKKKKKKRTILFNTGHRFGNRLQNEVDLTTSSGGKDSQEEKRAPSPVVTTTRQTSMKNSILLPKIDTSNWKTG